MKAHQNGGTLHRAISVFVFNERRPDHAPAEGRNQVPFYRFMGKNTCCSHPFKGPSAVDAAHRQIGAGDGLRLRDGRGIFVSLPTRGRQRPDRMGVRPRDVRHVRWRAPEPSPEEAKDWKWATMEFLKDDVSKNPETYTGWFRILFTGRHHIGQADAQCEKVPFQEGCQYQPLTFIALATLPTAIM